jgi:hypothetical protein
MVWMTLKTILKERSHTQKATEYMIPFENLEKHTTIGQKSDLGCGTRVCWREMITNSN